MLKKVWFSEFKDWFTMSIRGQMSVRGPTKMPPIEHVESKRLSLSEAEARELAEDHVSIGMLTDQDLDLIQDAISEFRRRGQTYFMVPHCSRCSKPCQKGERRYVDGVFFVVFRCLGCESEVLINERRL